MTVTTKPFKKGFKYPIYPTEAQCKLFEQTFGCCRYVYNRALAEAKQEYDFYIATKDLKSINPVVKPDVSGYAFVNRLTVYKKDPESIWLNEVNAVSLQQAMLHLGSAFNRFFKERKGYPNFKKRHSRQSFNLMKTAFRLKDKELYIAKSKEPLKVHWTRDLTSEPSSCTISRTSTGRYYISFVCEYQPVKTSGTGRIGIDLGIKDFITLNTGEKVANPKHYVTAQLRLRRLSQSLSRKTKGSNNRNKARKLLARQHERVANSRNDFQHKLSRRLVNENQVIGLEKLIVKNMVRNRKLAKHISDAAWASLTQKLEYKVAESQHSTLVYMDTWFPSSHLCHVTRERLDRKLSLSERSWLCPHCSQTHDRDVNAAVNILNESLLSIALLDPAEIAGRVVLTNAKL